MRSDPDAVSAIILRGRTRPTLDGRSDDELLSARGIGCVTAFRQGPTPGCAELRRHLLLRVGVRAGRPLLFKGDDFTQTDIASVL